MSTEDPDVRHANPGGDVDGTADTAAYREYGRRLLKEQPEFTAAMFAGRMFDRFGMSPERATDLYDELTEQAREPDAYIDDPDFSGDVDAVREHYRRVRPVYERFADLDGAPTTGFFGNSGWYRYEDGSTPGIKSRRAYTFEEDYDQLVSGIERDDDTSWRSAYNITSWKDRSAVYAGAEAEHSEFGAGDGLAGYADMRGFPLWVDLDLRDNDGGANGPNYKRLRGDLPDDVRSTVEQAYQAYVDEFADLCGVESDAIAVFDSGGGGYLYTPAAVTLPIAEQYEGDSGRFGDTRKLLFEEIRQRLFAYATGTAVNKNAGDYGFEGIQARVNDRVDGAADLLDPDWMQNRNRQSKAPLAIHGDHDVVVTPARPVGERDGIEYEPTLVSDVDDELIEYAAREAEKIVTVPDDDVLDEWTDEFVSALFPEFDDADGWQERLDAWLAERRAERRDRIHQRALDERRQRERLRERGSDSGGGSDSSGDGDRTAAELLDSMEVTPVRKDVFDVLDGATKSGAECETAARARELHENDELLVDVRDVIKKYAADTDHPDDSGPMWYTSDRGHEITFRPSWRYSGEGQSCAIQWVEEDPDTEEVSVNNGFVDNKCDGGGGPAKAYALGTGILPSADDPTEKEEKNAAAESLSGKQWADAVDGLRSEGYPIPMYVPEAGSETPDGDTYEKTPLWGLRKAAVALDVCDRDEFVEHETDDGGTYLGFEAPDYNAVLRALDDAGIDHGREPIETDRRSGYYDADLVEFVDDETDADPWTDPDTMLRACLRARDAGAVSEHVTPPTMALLPLRRDVLGQQSDQDMSSGTKDLLEDLFHELDVDELDDVLGAE